jgi:hypothetical protein
MINLFRPSSPDKCHGDKRRYSYSDTEFHHFTEKLQNTIAPLYLQPAKYTFSSAGSVEEKTSFDSALNIDGIDWITQILRDVISDIVMYGCAYRYIEKNNNFYHLIRLNPQQIIQMPMMTFQKQPTGLRWIDTSHLVRFDFPAYLAQGLKRLYKYRPTSDSGLPRFIIQDLQEMSRNFDLKEYERKELLRFLKRFHCFSYIDPYRKTSEIYLLYKNLRFLVHCATIERSLVKQLNNVLKTICAELNISPVFIEIQTTRSIDEINQQIQKLLEGEASLKSISNFIDSGHTHEN